MPGLPVRLARAPLIEAVFEIRFKGAQEGIGDLLPGLMYGSLKDLFQRVEQMSFGRIPKELVQVNPDLMYRPQVRLAGPEIFLMIGDRIAALSKVRPYDGWPKFQSRCESVIRALRETGLAGEIERFSLKSVNLLEMAEGALSMLNVDFRLGHQSLTNQGLRLRAEIANEPFVSIVEVGSSATIEVSGKTLTGTLVAIDTLRTIETDEFWNHAAEELNRAHVIMKGIFFDLLTPATVEALEPEWTPT